MIAHYILNAFKSVILDFLNLVVRVLGGVVRLSVVVYSLCGVVVLLHSTVRTVVQY